LLTLAVPNAVMAIYSADPGVMVEGCDSTDDFDAVLKDPRRNAAVIGPGFGAGPLTADRVLRLLETDKSVVLDADALTSFASKPDVLLAACKARKSATVFTPHEGEFARLFDVKGSKVERARFAAAKAGAIVILKGPDTVIAAPDGHAATSKTAGPWLATGGSGDVLAGFVAGLLAQGMRAFDAAAAAVWIHGACGDRFGPGLIAEDLPDAAPAAIRALLGR
jgi:NAD(P)H-hydrate epimerase